MTAAALAAARRLKDGDTLGACPQTTILELLQIIEAAAAEPPANDQVKAGMAAMLKFTDRVSTKKDPEGVVLAILVAAKGAAK